MNNIISVSVIIPIYNSYRTLPNTIKSVLNQSYQNIELILVDDGSTDGSEKICDYYAKMDNRVVVIHKKNEGISKARNTGLAKAKGEYIAFLDHDDIIGKDLVRDNYQLAVKYNADLVKFSYKEVDEVENRFLEESRGVFSHKVIKGKEIQENYKDLIEKRYLVGVWDGLFREEIIKRSKANFDSFFQYGNEDIDFCMKIFPYLNILVINKKIYYLHILYKESTSGKFSDEKIKGVLELMHREKNMLLSLNIDLYKDEFWYQRVNGYALSIIAKLKNKSSQIKKEAIEQQLLELRSELYCLPKGYKKEKFTFKQTLYLFLFDSNYIKLITFLIISSRWFNKVFNR